MMIDVPSTSPAVLMPSMSEMNADGGTARYAMRRSSVVAARIAARFPSGGSGTNRRRFANEAKAVFCSGVLENCFTDDSARSRKRWSFQSNGAAPMMLALGRQQLLAVQVVERGDQLSLRKITGGADDDDVLVGRRVERHQLREWSVTGR